MVCLQNTAAVSIWRARERSGLILDISPIATPLWFAQRCHWRKSRFSGFCLERGKRISTKLSHASLIRQQARLRFHVDAELQALLGQQTVSGKLLHIQSPHQPLSLTTSQHNGTTRIRLRKPLLHWFLERAGVTYP